MCVDNLKFDISGPVVLGVTLSRLCSVAVYFHVYISGIFPLTPWYTTYFSYLISILVIPSILKLPMA